jgi:ParB/RepB/Spo0J family partition protein
MATLGERIKSLRDEAGWSGREVERRGALAAGTVSRLESGVRDNPEFSVLEGLARAFGITVGALVGDEARDAPAAAGGVTMLAYDALAPSGVNPRQTFDDAALGELAASIEGAGVLQNLVATRPDPDTEPSVLRPARIVAGERRWRAIGQLVKAGTWDRAAPNIPVRLIEGGDDDLLALALLENLQRIDLPAVEEAEAFAALQAINDRRWSASHIAARIGKSVRYVQGRLQLLRLGETARDALHAGLIPLDVARALTAAEPERQATLIEEFTSNYTSLRTAKDVRARITGALAPVDWAIFRRAKYTGAMVTDDLGNEFFADREEFRTLQEKALTSLMKTLRETWAFARRVDYWQGWRYERCEDRARGGAFVVLEPTGQVKTWEGWIERAPAEDEAESEEERAEWAAREAAAARARAARAAFNQDLATAIANAGALDLARILAYGVVAGWTTAAVNFEEAGGGSRSEAWRARFPDGLFDDEPDGLVVDDIDDTAPVWTTIAALDDTDLTQLLGALLADGVGGNAYWPVSSGDVALARALGVAIPEDLPVKSPVDAESAESDVSGEAVEAKSDVSGEAVGA